MPSLISAAALPLDFTNRYLPFVHLRLSVPASDISVTTYGLVDTGSSLSIISLGLVTHLKQNHKNSIRFANNHNVIVANGDNLSVIGYIDLAVTLQPSDPSVQRPVTFFKTFAVIDHRSARHLIFGADLVFSPYLKSLTRTHLTLKIPTIAIAREKSKAQSGYIPHPMLSKFSKAELKEKLQNIGEHLPTEETTSTLHFENTLQNDADFKRQFK